jgi:hypothetical protein
MLLADLDDGLLRPVSLMCGDYCGSSAVNTQAIRVPAVRDAERDGLCERVLVAIGAIGNVERQTREAMGVHPSRWTSLPDTAHARAPLHMAAQWIVKAHRRVGLVCRSEGTLR